MGDLIQFAPRSRSKADRAFWIGNSPISVMAHKILDDVIPNLTKLTPDGSWLGDEKYAYGPNGEVIPLGKFTPPQGA